MTSRFDSSLKRRAATLLGGAILVAYWCAPARADDKLELILPGALAHIILGFRTSMAYGWRALVGAELIAGTSGLGYLTMDSVVAAREA